MIVRARRLAPRAQNYRGVWSGLGAVAPTYEKCFPTDSACVARNSAAGAAYGAAQLSDFMAARLAYCLSDPGNNPASCHAEFDPGGSYAATANAGQPVQGYVPRAPNLPTPAVSAPSGGRLNFTTSRGGTSLQVGDTWQVSITGATPNAPVTASGSMPGSSFSGSAMGSTDGAGNFSKSGTLDSSSVGAWQESWAVGGASSGSISFSVAAPITPAGQTIIQSSGAQSVPSATATPAGQTIISSSGATSPSVSLPTVGGFDLSTIPWWGWAGAAGVALFAFGGGRGR